MVIQKGFDYWLSSGQYYDVACGTLSLRPTLEQEDDREGGRRSAGGREVKSG